MGVLYGLAAAVLWGTGDFFARLASERVGSHRTIFYMQLFAAGVMVPVIALPLGRPAHLALAPLGGAVLFGVLNVCGGALFYRSLEIGTVSLVSPVSSTFAAVAATLAITVAGERPLPLQLAGLAICAAGVIGASIPPRSGGVPTSRRGLPHAVGAALLWGVAFFSLRYIVHDLGPFFTVWVGRLASVVLLGVISAVRGQSLEPPRSAWAWILGIAVVDSSAAVFYNLGVATQLTAVVSILSSLFSAVTVILAFVVLNERLSRLQWSAVAVILAGVGMVSSAG